MRSLILLSAIVALTTIVSAQPLTVDATAGFGPFTPGVTTQNTFTVNGIGPSENIESISFTIVGTQNGSQPLQTFASQSGRSKTFTTNMGGLPRSATLIVHVETMLASNKHRSEVIHRDIAMRTYDPVITSTTGMRPIVVGTAAQHRYSISSLPPSTSKVVLRLRNAKGQVIDSVVRTGAAIDTASIVYKTTNHQRGVTLSAMYVAASTPATGDNITMTLQDSVPVPAVKAALGWGPFQQGNRLVNTFTVKGLGASCTKISWWIDAIGRYGLVYGLDSAENIPYSAVTDSIVFTSDMGLLLPNAALHVVAYYGSTTVDSAQTTYQIQITPQNYGPHFFTTFTAPLTWGSSAYDYVYVDSLPVRSTKVRLSMIDQQGNLYFRHNTIPTFDLYVDTASIVFTSQTLPLYTTTVRCEIWNDYEPLPIEYDYSFDVRDTSLPYLFANTWGPFVQTDSAYIVLGAKWMRPIGLPTDSIIGRFTIRDTVLGTTLASSVYVPLTKAAYDSTVYWLDSTGSRPLIITGGFPLGVEARFTRYAVRGSDTVELQFTRHPISMLPSPGILTASNGYGPFIAGRDSMNTFRMTNLPPGTREVEFRVTGTRNPAAIDSMLVQSGTSSTLDSAVFTTNMGMLPVNARLHVNVRYDGGPDDGVQLDRFIHTVPDTLAATSTAGFGPLNFSWAGAPRTYSPPSNYDIVGVAPIPTTFTIKRLPAQTLSIAVFTKDDAGKIIDSTLTPVPYQLRFNRNLTVAIPFNYRQLNTALLEVILYTDGGPSPGIQYPMAMKVNKPDLRFDVYKTVESGASPASDTSAILQGSTNTVYLGLSLGVAPDGKQFLSLAGGNRMDSVRYRFRDCNSSVDDSLQSQTAAVGARTNIMADTLYTITPLPITVRTTEVNVYSSSLHFPLNGFTYIDSINIVPNPDVDTLYGRWYPTYRATDTVNGQMMQTFTLTHLGNVDSVTNIRWLDANGATVGTIPTKIPKNDTVLLTYNMNSFPNAQATLRLIGTFNYHRCSARSTRDILLDTAIINPQFPGSPQRNFIWSSLGWGPFQQGKSASSWFLVSLDPSLYISAGSHDSTDQLTIQITGRDSVGNTVFTMPAVSVNYGSGALPTSSRFRTVYQQLGGLAPRSTLNVHVTWSKVRQTGTTVMGQSDYRFPVTMLKFPPQPLFSDHGWGPFEQSVAAGGYQGIKVMSAPITITDSVQSTIMGSILGRLLDHNGVVQDSVSFTKGNRIIRPNAKNPNQMDTIDLWTMSRAMDPAQVGWPSVSKDQTHLDLEIDYTFQQYSASTANQTQVITMNPRADWINGTQITADSATSGSIYLTSLIPLPTPGFEKTLPLLGPLPMSTSRADGGSGPLDFKINAIYTPSNGQFQFNPNSTYNNAGFTWNSNISTSIIKGGRAAYVNDGQEHDGFKAEQDFVTEGSRLNREMAIRQLITANLSGNLLAPYTIIKEAMEIIESGLTIISAAPTIALWVGSEQYYTLNLGTDGSGVLKYSGTLPPTEESAEDYKNVFPTGLANSFSSTLSRGMEVSIAGFFGAGVSIDDQTVIGWGKTYTGAVNAIQPQDWPAASAQRTYFTVDLDLMFGLIHIDLYHGLIEASYDPDLMPSFYTFPEIKASVFISNMGSEKIGEHTEQVTLSYRPLPPETPFYYPRPDAVGSANALSMTWMEHALHGNSSDLLLGTVDPEKMVMKVRPILASNQNGMHDPSMAMVGTTGDAIVAWTQNRFNASNAPSMLNAQQLLRAEDVHVGVFNAATGSITEHLVIEDDQRTAMSGRIDGKSKIVTSKDGNSAAVVWPAQLTVQGTSDVFCMWMRKNNGVWTSSTVMPVGMTPGVDRDVQVVRTSDSDVVVVWVNERSFGIGHTSVMWSHWNGTTWTPAATLLDTLPNRHVQSITLAAREQGAVLVVNSTDHVGQNTPIYSLREVWYQNGTWTQPKVMHQAEADHAIRRLAAAVNADDRVVVLAETESAAHENGTTDHGLLAFVKNQGGSGGSWKITRNSPALCDTTNQLWYMDASFGPHNVLYVASQELDSIPNNVQSYSNGIRVGPSRLNMVLRAAVVNEDLTISAKPFAGQPTSVDDGTLEATLRYQARMYPAYPNPTQATINIPFVLQMPTHVSLSIVDVTGRVVESIRNEDMAEGQYDLAIPTSALQQGLYRVRLVTSTGQTLTMPFTIVR